MVSNEVVLTYKRKRFSDKSNVVHGIEATDSSSDSPNLISMRISHSQAESNTCSEKLNEDNVHCFKCGAFHVNENLLDCDNCSGTYHLRCTEPPFKNIPQGMWQCAACIKGQVFEESMQQQAPKSNRARNTRSTQESNTGPMKLHSNKLLLSVKSVKDSLSKVSSPPIDASASKMADVIQIDNYSNSECMVAAAGCTSRSQLTGFNCLRKSSSTFLDSSSEGKYNSGCQDDSVLRTIDLNKKVNVMCNDEHPKENCSTPLITFSRRLKKKRNMGEEFSGRDSKVGDKQLSLPSLNDFSSNGSCKHESLLLNCSVTDQSNNVSMLLGQTELRPSHVLRQDKIDEEDAGLKITATGCFPDTKIVGKIGERFPSCREEACKLMPSNHAEHILEDSSNKVLADPTPDIIGVSLSAHKNKQLKVANINTSVESRNKLDIGANNLQKASVPCNVSEERDLSKNQELPVALASSTCPSNLELNKLYTGTVPEELSVVQHASTCLSNMEINKPSMDVAAEKIVESQNLSTSNCTVLSLDEKSKGKVKGLEWLEDLDIALQDTTKDTKMSFVEQGGISCGQASNGNASHLFVAPTSIDQDASQEFMNHSSALQERTFLTKMGGPGYNKLQHKEVCNTSLFSDILGLSLQLSAEAPTSSVKNFRSMPSATLGGKENNIHASQFPWDVLNGNQSLLRHKQIVDNVMMGSLMLKERQASLLENSKGYLVEWSEDELDSLWIGVRRHGLDNWNAMLRDPKLFFSESRGAEDLAERWNREQKKLFNGTLMQPIRPSRLDILPSPPMNDALLSKPVVGNQYGHYGSWSSELRRLTTETRLSLGDVYFQKENVPKKNLFNMSGLGMTNVFTSENPSTGASILGGSLESPICPGIGNQNPFEAQSRRFAPEQSSLLQKNVERSSHENRSDGISAGCNLPHWLKEVVSMPPRASGPGSTGALMNANSVSLLNNEQQADTSFLSEPPLPPKDCRRGILKRRSMASGHNIGCNEPWMEARPGMHSTMGQNFLKPVSNNGGLDQNSTLDSNKKSSGPVRPSELVVIESDASSEETISDDQSSRL